MVRLPVDQGDPEQWGVLLNAFLSEYLSSATGWPRWPAEQLGVPLASGEASSDRRFLGSAGAGASGELHLSYFTATKSESVTQLAMYSAATAAATVTLVRFGVYQVAANGDLTLLAATANDATVFTSTNTRYARSLTSTWTKAAGTRYAVGHLVVATTPPAVYGPSDLTVTAVDTIWAREPRISAKRASQTDLPASITSANLTDTRRNPFVECLP